MALTMNDLKKAVIARDVEIARLRAALENVAACGGPFTIEELSRQGIQWRLGYHANDPVKDCLAAGMQALLRGDTAERDRQMERARKIMDAQQATPKVTIGAAEIVTRLLMIAERQAGRALTERERLAITQNPKAFGEYLIKIGHKIPEDIAAGTFATT